MAYTYPSTTTSAMEDGGAVRSLCEKSSTVQESAAVSSASGMLDSTLWLRSSVARSAKLLKAESAMVESLPCEKSLS